MLQNDLVDKIREAFDLNVLIDYSELDDLMPMIALWGGVYDPIGHMGYIMLRSIDEPDAAKGRTSSDISFFMDQLEVIMDEDIERLTNPKLVCNSAESRWLEMFDALTKMQKSVFHDWLRYVSTSETEGSLSRRMAEDLIVWFEDFYRGKP